jgi:hyperosmotically inducible protein
MRERAEAVEAEAVEAEAVEGMEASRSRTKPALAALWIAAALFATACVPEERTFEGTRVTLVSADAALAGAVQQALVAEGIAIGEVAVTVANGTVALRGEVADPTVRTEAEAAARAVDGVEDVRNEISVRANTPLGESADAFDLRSLFARR